MTYQEAIDRLTALAAIAASGDNQTLRQVYLSRDDELAITLAIKVLENRLIQEAANSRSIHWG